MRNISDAAKAAAYAQETGEAFIVLLLIEHDDLSDPIRVNNSGAEVESNGETFVAFPFEITFPEDIAESPGRMKLKIDNTDRQIVLAVRSITSAPTCTVQVVMASDPDTIEAEYPDYKLTNVRYDAGAVEADLTLEEFTTEPYPSGTFTASMFPGLF